MSVCHVGSVSDGFLETKFSFCHMTLGVEDVSKVAPGFWRVQAVIINFRDTRLLLINSYFLTDPQRPNVDDH